MFKNDLKKAVSILQKGGLVAMPTETVYGLAADAKNPDALKKIFQAKGRPVDHPLIVHMGDISELKNWAFNVSDQAYLLAQKFWPGPLTLILKKAPGVLDLITGSQETIGIRMPNHPVALELLKMFGSGVAAPSANRFGRISPTTAKAVAEELGSSVDLILEGGQCDVGVESTIVDMSGKFPRILRPGMISVSEIEQVLHEHLSSQQDNLPRVSGSLESHYAPTTKTFLMDQSQIQKWLKQNPNEKIALMIHSFELNKNNIHTTQMPKNPKEYAHDLYHTLRELDHQGFAQIIIEKVPNESEWAAIEDRLQRAAF